MLPKTGQDDRLLCQGSFSHTQQAATTCLLLPLLAAGRAATLGLVAAEGVAVAVVGLAAAVAVVGLVGVHAVAAGVAVVVVEAVAVVVDDNLCHTLLTIGSSRALSWLIKPNTYLLFV